MGLEIISVFGDKNITLSTRESHPFRGESMSNYTNYLSQNWERRFLKKHINSIINY